LPDGGLVVIPFYQGRDNAADLSCSPRRMGAVGAAIQGADLDSAGAFGDLRGGNKMGARACAKQLGDAARDCCRLPAGDRAVAAAGNPDQPESIGAEAALSDPARSAIC